MLFRREIRGGCPGAEETSFKTDRQAEPTAVHELAESHGTTRTESGGQQVTEDIHHCQGTLGGRLEGIKSLVYLLESLPHFKVTEREIGCLLLGITGSNNRELIVDNR